ncbi:FAD-dependent oxidoreductase [Nonomuraea basaltis]|uniref:FAD-dependent oxidoreductase n=1 Tax=Nonomuraea basaltis TaxID=2495887 RepID=UPI00110C60E1|nr:FAD-dependent oxidoreductase [Nonomuraea basaltis]TMR97411.1 FAD-dependent oxidoreductase [Nonomuraea basaltis]
MPPSSFRLATAITPVLGQVPQVATVDVLVAGGGSAGCVAAIAAARSGARVLLVERHGSLGGIGTSVLDTFYGFYTPGPNAKVVGGIAQEVVDALTMRDAAFIRPNTYGAGGGVTYSPEVLTMVWDELVAGSGADVLFHTMAIDVIVDAEGGDVTDVLLATRNGLLRASASVVVDCTGDADICAHAGAGYDGAETGEPVQALTTTFRVANVDTDRARSFPKQELFELMAQAASHGDYELPRQEGSIHRTPVDGVSLANMTRVVGVDPTDVRQLTRAEMDGRRQVGEYVRFLRDLVPGYEKASLVGLSSHIGVREARRVHGDYRLTADDVLSAQRFDDAIAQCGAPIEDHSGGTDTLWRYIPDNGVYDIPLRCLLPVGLNNVIVAGRCLSATHEAHASARSIAQCMAMGQAAGTLAALSSASRKPLRQIDVAELQRHLCRDGAMLSPKTSI